MMRDKEGLAPCICEPSRLAMFERNPVDNRSETLIAVELTLGDASVVSGRAVVAPGRGIHKLLEGDDVFIYVETFQGEGIFVPKSEIRGLKVINAGRSATGRLATPDARHFEPYKILGLEKSASFEDIRDAYHRLSKLYHPDRYAGVELPNEVRSYLEATAKSVNAAFQALKYVGQKTQAIYSRGA